MATHEDFSRGQVVKQSGLRAFGAVFVVAFALVGLWPLWSQGGMRVWALVVALVLLAVTLVAPALLALPNKLWMRFGALLHRIVSPIVLAFMFYVVVTPIGMLKRAVSRGDFTWRRGGSADTYWKRRDPPGPKPDSLTHQF
jgi:membrane glycosyltransferase